MTVRDREVLELLEGEPELLAIADAVAETQRQPRPRALRRLSPVVVVAALATAVVLALLVLPIGGGPGVVDRALAAVGNARVLHLVVEMPTGESFVDLKTGQRDVQTMQYELWTDAEMKRTHFVMHYGGQIAGDVLLPDDLESDGAAGAPSPDPAFAALWTGYREALAAGTATVDRKDRMGNRDVYWLRFPGYGDRLRTEVAVDAATYKPIVFRNHLGEDRYVDERVLVAETVPFAPAQFARRGPPAFAAELSAGGGSGYSWGTDTEQHPVVKAPWLTPGDRMAGLHLFAVSPLTVDTDDGKTIDGIVLLYGSQPSTDATTPPDSPELTIEQTSRPDYPRAWQHIPAGSVAIHTGTTTSSSRGTHSSWTGTLVKNGIYVTIATERSEAAVLAVARALRPAP